MIYIENPQRRDLKCIPDLKEIAKQTLIFLFPFLKYLNTFLTFFFLSPKHLLFDHSETCAW